MIIRIAFGIFLVLHGVVHLLYAGHSRGMYELQSELRWPAGSWVFSRLADGQAARAVATGALLLAAAGFVVGGIGLLFGQAWWRIVTAGTAIFSVAIYLLFWDGSAARLADQGAVGVAIDLAILAGVYVL